MVSNFRVKLDLTSKRCSGKRRRAKGRDANVLFHIRIFLLLFLLVPLWFGSGFLTSLRGQVSDLASVRLEHIPNVEHMLKSTVEYKPYRPAGTIQKYLGNAVLFLRCSLLSTYKNKNSAFWNAAWRRAGHFLLGGRLDLLKRRGEYVCVMVHLVCFADVQALIHQSPSAVSD